MKKSTSRRTLRDRFETKVIRTDGCWLWAGAHINTGYGVIAVKCDDGKWRPRLCHRIAYELFVGPIPDGLTLDHLCRTPGCCNPAHLEPVTQQINMLRGDHPSALARRNGKCKRGHALMPDVECPACAKARNDRRSRLTQPKTLQERFESKYVLVDGCWLWTGAVLGGGHGGMRVKGHTVTARRVAYGLYVGPLLPGDRVSITCGNRTFVNPSHLSLAGRS